MKRFAVNFFNQKGWIIISIFCLALLILYGCERFSDLPEGVIAVVNKENITAEEFNKEFKGMLLEAQAKLGDPNTRKLKEAFLNQIIERKILVQEGKKLGLMVSKEELDKALHEIRLDYKEGELLEKLKLMGMSLGDLKQRLEEKILAEKMIRSVADYHGGVDEKEALRFYEENRSYFQVPEMVRVRQIVVSDGQEAIQILKRLKKGENFEELARQKSIGPEKEIGGDLGYFSRGERPSEFDLVFEMEVGKISDIIKTPYGYHIFKLEEKIEAREIPFEEVKSRIIQTIAKKKGEENFRQWLKKLKEKAKIKVNQDWLNS